MSKALVGKQIDGVWHTGIVIYGKEFYYGGGISHDAPAATPFGKYRTGEVNQLINAFISIIGQPTKVMDLGETEVPEELFMELLEDIAPRFNASTYDVLKHNCNNFTDEVAKLVLGEGIPSDIVDLP